MIKLDYSSVDRYYTVAVRNERGLSPDLLMREYGLDYSPPSSSFPDGVNFTPDPYAALSFYEHATPAAADKLGWMAREVAASWSASSDRHIECPVDKQLEPFQRADVDYIMRREHALDADEPGLGKTPTAICVANEMQAKRCIVVCPANIRLQWQKRIYQWSTMRDPRVYPVLSSRMGMDINAEWTIISYDLARNPAILRAIVKGEYDLGIFDEVHYAKEISTGRARACFGYYDKRKDDGESLEIVTECIANRCKRLLLLSGTPLPNRPREVYPVARAACWNAIDWMSQKTFNERFNPRNIKKGERKDGSEFRYAEEATGRAAELQNRLRTHFMTRHLDKDVRKQMHYPVYDLIYVDETTAIKAALKAERLLDFNPDTFTGEGGKFYGHVATARRLMGEAIAPQAADYLKILINGGEKLCVFAWHTSVLDILEKQLKALFIHYPVGQVGLVRIDGNDGPTAKELKKCAFIDKPEVRILIGNILSLGTGTDGIQEVCSHGLIVEPDWVPGNNVQCFKRLDRMGQNNGVFGEIFVAPGSIAEHVLASALRKGLVIHNALDRRVTDAVQLW